MNIQNIMLPSENERRQIFHYLKKISLVTLIGLRFDNNHFRSAIKNGLITYATKPSSSAQTQLHQAAETEAA